MLCDECKKRPASVHVTRILNGVKREYNLCSECARRLGIAAPTAASGLFQSLFEGNGGKKSAVVCPKCGTDLRDFDATGYLGCPHCYEAFSAHLDSVIRRMQGSNSHVGSRPKTAVETPEMKYRKLAAELSAAVEAERFEDAARLRDQMRALKGEGK